MLQSEVERHGVKRRVGTEGEGKREGKFRDLLPLVVLTLHFRSGVSKFQAV